MMRWPGVSLIILALSLSSCVSEQEQRRQAQAEYHAQCRAEIQELKRTTADRWERRIAQNEIIARCVPEKASLAAISTAYARVAQRAVKDGKWTDEEAWLNHVQYMSKIEREYNQDQIRLEEARIQAAGQALMGIGMSGGLFKPSPPMPVYQPSRPNPPVSCSGQQIGQTMQMNCY